MAGPTIECSVKLAALDRETENLRATLAAEAEKEDASKSKIIVPEINS